MAGVRFGVFAPQGWKTELAGIPDPVAKWARCRDTAVLAEQLGYDSVWVYDHFHNVPTPAHEAVFECWTVMAALAEATSTIRLGQMVSCTSYRPPALTAKITSSIDVISGGRLEWGVGAGWYDHEYRAYGYEFPTAKVRIGMLREAVEIVTAMWREPDTTYEGEYYQVRGAQCDPKPVQQPRPPVWIGGGGEQLTLRVVARLADKANFGGKPHEWAHKRDVLHAHCAAVGRDPAEIELTWSPAMLRARDGGRVAGGGDAGSSAGVAGALRLLGRREPGGDARAGVPSRSASTSTIGCTYFVPWCSDYPDDTTLRLFADQVMPAFK